MSDPSNARGVRLADVRVPRYWRLSLLGGLALSLLWQRRQVKAAARVGTEIGESVVERWRQTDETADSMYRLNRTMTHLTWVVTILTVATLAVAIITLVEG